MLHNTIVDYEVQVYNIYVHLMNFSCVSLYTCVVKVVYPCVVNVVVSLVHVLCWVVEMMVFRVSTD